MAYTKINWQDLPSTQTPINDTNLKHMDDGIYANDQAFLTNGLNVSNEVDEDYRVNFLKSKNLFNDFFEIGTVDSSGINTSSTTRLRNNGFIKVKPNTTYSISYTTSSNLKVSISYYANNSYSTNRLSYDAFTTDNPLTFTTPNNCNYIRIIVGLTNDGAISSTSIISNVMINEGSTALPYEPYITPSINVDNEVIYSKPVVLWTNSSPTSDFAGQQITLSDSLNNYSYYEVLFLMSKYESMCVSTGLIPSNMNTCLLSLRNANNVGTISRYRDVVKDSNTILGFGSCSQCTAGSTSTTTANDRVIPYQVIGHK